MGRAMVCVLSVIFCGLLATNGWAAPAINSVSGTMTHNQAVTISGSGFGSKPSAAPVVWDNCQGLDPAALWDGYYPLVSEVGAGGALNYRTPAQVGRGCQLPTLASPNICLAAGGRVVGAM